MVELEKLAATDPVWKKRLDDTRAGAGAIRLTLEGEGETWVAAKDGVATVHDSAPDVPTRFAVSVDAEAARSGLAELLGLDLNGKDTPEALVQIARVASARVDKLIEKESLGFHLIIKDVPDLDVVTIKCGLGVPAVPEKTNFTATVSFDSLEDLREKKINPQQLLMTRVKIVGDATRFMTFVMTAMQPIR